MCNAFFEIMPYQLCFFFFLLFPLNWSLELSYSVLTSLGGACPPKDTCSTLLDPRDDHLWGGRTCECGPHCGMRATCCIDANRRVHSGDSKEFETCRGVTGGFSVWMVDKCPNGDDSHFQEKCEEPLGTNQDPLMSAPVTSETSGRTYLNYFCALCHQDAETAIVWDISLQGLTPEQANQTTSVLLEQLVFDPVQESWGLMVYRSRTRIPKIERVPVDTNDHSVDKVSPSYSKEHRNDGGIEIPLKLTVPAEHIPKKSEAFDGSNGKEVSQKNVELNIFNEEVGRGDFIQQESINAEENINEFSFTKYNQKPQNSITLSQQSVDILPSYLTQFRFQLNNRAGNQGADGRNFKIKESNKPYSSGSMGDYTLRTLNPKKDGQTPKDGIKELSQVFNFNPTVNHQKFYSPLTSHGIESGIPDQTPFIRPKRDELRSVQSHSAEITKTKGNIQPPTNPPTFQKVNIKFSVPIRLRQWATKCYPNMIHSCPDSYTGQDVRDACTSYYAPVRLRVAGTRLAKFRNIHCGLCHNATSYEGSCVLEQASRKKSKFDFSMLLDVNRDEEGQGERCEKGQVFDPFFKKCRTLKCGRPNFIVKEKKCVEA